LPETAYFLAAVAEGGAQLAIGTGRPALDAVRFGDLADVPGLVVYGHYGLERWSSEGLASPSAVEGVDAARSRLRALAGRYPGTTVEDKGHSVAVHTRQAPDPAGVLEEIRPDMSVIARESGLQLTPGRFVFELRPPGIDKGYVVRALARDISPLAIVYAGDDLGDLPAVDAVRALESDGIAGFVICSDATDEIVPALRDRADLVVAGPAGVLDFLRGLLETSEDP
jgi:trehalose 6-phosphate phosphatase